MAEHHQEGNTINEQQATASTNANAQTDDLDFVRNLKLMGLTPSPVPEDLKNIRYNLFKEGIKSACDETRIIFNLVEKFNDKKKECNGLILNLENLQPLVYNPYVFQTNINTVKANKFLNAGLYDIYRIHDGTCFNLYYYNKWVIATNNGYDMNNQLWYGVSFQDAISECLAKLPNAISWERFTDQLDKNCCYSFGFKNPKYHKFFEYNNTEIYDFWFIHSYDLRYLKLTQELIHEHMIELVQEPRKAFMCNRFNYVSPFAFIRNQTLYTKQVNSLKELYNIAYHSYNNYKTNIRNLSPEHLTNDNVCYGFILRSKDQQKTGEHSNLLIKSSLLRHIQNAFNDEKITKLCKQYGDNRKDLIITLYAFLKNNEEFRILFPNLQPTYTKVIDVVNKIINNVVNKLNTSAHVTSTESGADTSTHTEEYENIVNSIIDNFKKVSYNLNGKSIDYRRKIIKEFIQNPDYFNLLITAFA